MNLSPLKINAPSNVPPAAPTATPPFCPDDPVIDARDGSRAILVTSLFGDTVIGVHQLDGTMRGRARPVTLGLLFAAAGLLLGGVACTIASQVGLGALLLLAGVGLGIYGKGSANRERRAPHFSVGEDPRASVPLLASVLPAPLFPLVRAASGGYELLFSEGMEGEVAVGAVVGSLGDLVATGRAHPAGDIPDAFAFPMPEAARVRVTLGENTFLVHAVAPARGVQGALFPHMDWQTQVWNSLSVATHASVLFIVFSVPPSGAGLDVDSFNTDNIKVRYEVRPRAFDESVPGWLKTRQEMPPGNKMQKAIGPQGKAGSPTAEKRGGRFALIGPANNQDLHAARQLALSSVRTAGVLGLLGQRSGGPIASLFGRESALGNEALEAMGGLQGDQVGEDYGIGGMGLTGPGWGGGDGKGLIPTGHLDTIGDRVGGPGGGFGPPASRLPPRKRQDVVPERATAVTVLGALDKELIRREIRRHLNEVRFCYQKQLQGKPDLDGRIVVRFTIAGTGQVVSARVQESTMKDASVESCIAQAFYRWTFPKPENSGMVIVSYPFLFHPTGASD
jgi:hypothetical protein